MTEEIKSHSEAQRALRHAQERYANAKAKAEKIAVQLNLAKVAAAAADRRQDTAMKVHFGALALTWAKRDARFAAYCARVLANETLTPRAASLLHPLIPKFQELVRQSSENGGADNAAA